MSGREAIKPRHHGKGRYTSEQIRAVLAFNGSVTQAAAASGVGWPAARDWRAGFLPQWFVDEQQAKASARAAVRRSRFYKPDDARAAR